MAVTKELMVHRYKSVKQQAALTPNVEFIEGRLSAYAEIMEDMLSDQERLIMVYITAHEQARTGELATFCQSNVRAINGTLKRLMGYGLIGRDKVVTEAGRWFVYHAL